MITIVAKCIIKLTNLFEQLTSVIPGEGHLCALLVVASVAQLARRRRESLSVFLPSGLGEY